MKLKIPEKAKKARLLILPILLLAMLSGVSHAQVSNFCSQITSSSITGTVVGSGTTTLLWAFVIVLIMILLASIAYMLGYAFHIDKLTRFSLSELGEIAVTVIVILVFFGALFLSSPASGNFFALSNGNFGASTFQNDCLTIGTTAQNMIGQIESLLAQQLGWNFVSGINYKFYITYFGAEASPLAGFAYISNSVGYLVPITGGIFAFLLAVMAAFYVIYSLFPLFLFLGIILRAFTVSRPAGGAFLGLFAGFYIAFPLLVSVLITCGNNACVGATAGIPNVLNGINGVTSWNEDSTTGLVNISPIPNFIESVLVPTLYVIFALIVSFLISFDFMEAVGDLLGAPSLSSSQVLKKLV